MDKTTALIGADEYNKDYCDQNDIVVVFSRNTGGNIINFKEDFNLAIMGEEKENMATLKLFLEKFAAFLKEKGLELCFVGNDFMLENHKVGSFAVKQLHRQNGARQSYIVIHLSVVADLEIIKKICLKPMVKVPRGLTEFGLTREEIQDFILNFEGKEND